MLLDNRRNANKLLGCIRIFGAPLVHARLRPQSAPTFSHISYYLPSILRKQKDETCCNVQDPTEEASN